MAVLPILQPGESAESWIRRAAPALRQLDGAGTATRATTVYDSTGREIAGPSGLFAYVGGRLVVAPDIVQIGTEDLMAGAVTLAQTNIPEMVTAQKVVAGSAVVLNLLAGEAVAVSARIDNLQVNDANIANVAVGKLTAGVIGTNAIYIGDTRLELNGVTGRIIVKDAGGYIRAEIGALAAGGNGITIRDAAGTVLLTSGSSAYLSGAFIDSLSASKITTGTLDASKATVTNLNASNITTGTLNVARLSVASLSAISANLGTVTAGTLGASVAYLGTIAADRITAGTLNAGNISWSGTISGIGNVGIQAYNTSNGTPVMAYSASGIAISGNAASNSSLPQTNAVAGIKGMGNNIGVLGVSSSQALYGLGGTYGVVGAGTSYDFYAGGCNKVKGSVVASFTGAHECLLNKLITVEPGDIVVDSLIVARNGVDDATGIVLPSTSPCDAGALGVFASRHPITDTDYPIGLRGADGELAREHRHLKDTHDNAWINAVGEGLINVCGEGGDIAPGDLIVTSSIRGKGQKQDDTILRNYTVARAREGAVFTGETDVRQIACIYLCG